MLRMEEQTITIGKRLAMLRQKNGLTQESLSEKLLISRQSVSKWERDGAVPDLEKLIMLSEIYHVSIDYLVKGEEAEKKEPAAEAETEKAESEERPEKAESEEKSEEENRVSGFILIVMLISGLFFLISLILTATVWFHYALLSNGNEQDIMTVTKIYEQYTRAEVQGVAKDGSLYTEIMWLDKQGVAEDDLLWGYADTPGHIKVPYYAKTVLAPLLCAVLFGLLFLLCFRKARQNRTDKKRNVKAAGIFLLIILILSVIPVVLVLFKKPQEEKPGSGESGREMQREEADNIPESHGEEGQSTEISSEEAFSLDGWEISLTVPLLKDFYVQGSYVGEDYHSVQLYGKAGGIWADCNLHMQTDFYENALDFMMIQLENTKEWEEKWTGRAIELQSAEIEGRICYFFEVHYKYDGSDIQKVVGACDIDASHFYVVDCEGMDYEGKLSFEQISALFRF